MALRIKPLTPADAQHYLKIYAPFVKNSHASFEYEIPDLSEIKTRIERVGERHHGLGLWKNQKFLGFALAGKHRDREGYKYSVETSIYFSPEARGNKWGHPFYEFLLEGLRLQGFLTAVAGIALPNPDSVALHENLGFQKIGTYKHIGFKEGKWIHTEWYQSHLSAPPKLPPNLISKEELFQLPHWQEKKILTEKILNLRLDLHKTHL